MTLFGLLKLPPRYVLIPVLAVVYLYLALSNGGPTFNRMDPGAHLFDEGFVANGGARIAAGAVMYRDFWAYYAPGQYYTLAGLFTLFGPTLGVERAWDFITRALVLLGVYLVAAQLTSRRAGLAPVCLVTLWLASRGSYSYVIFQALALALASMACLLVYGSGRRLRWLAASGFLVGVATVYRHDFGVYAVASEIGALGLLSCVRGGEARTGLADRVRRALRESLVFSAGLLAMVVPVAWYFLATVPAEELLFDFVIFPLRVFPGSWSLPYPPLLPDVQAMAAGQSSWGDVLAFLSHSWIPFYGPIALYIVGAVVFSVRCCSARSAPSAVTELAGLLLLTLFGAALFNQAIQRNDQVHLLPTSIVGATLLTVLAHRLAGHTRWRRYLLWTAPLLPAPAVGYLVSPAVVGAIILSTTAWPASAEALLPLAGPGPALTGQAQAIDYVRAQTAPGDKIFVGNARHDRATRNDAIFYFLAGRANATRYDDLLAARVNRADVQGEIIQNLRDGDVRYIVLFGGFQEYVEPNQSGVRGSVTRLDDYILEHYQPAARFGDYAVLSSD
ncbi:MAG: hypothetical protein IT307_00675 [Chloroflexi bacterium]|nr:hypothetical protein [Chloroflexota bacterium]